MIIEYPHEWEALIDETALRSLTSSAFEFHLVKRSQMEARVRLPEGRAASSLGRDVLPAAWVKPNSWIFTGRLSIEISRLKHS